MEKGYWGESPRTLKLGWRFVKTEPDIGDSEELLFSLQSVALTVYNRQSGLRSIRGRGVKPHERGQNNSKIKEIAKFWEGKVARKRSTHES